jgi:hypothetical protein
LNISTPPSGYKHTPLRIQAHPRTFFFSEEISERAYPDQGKQHCLSSSHLEKNFPSRKKSFFFQLFKLLRRRNLSNFIVAMSLLSSSDEHIFESLKNLMLRANEHAVSKDYAVILLRTKKSKLEVKRKA